MNWKRKKKTYENADQYKADLDEKIDQFQDELYKGLGIEPRNRSKPSNQSLNKGSAQPANTLEQDSNSFRAGNYGGSFGSTVQPSFAYTSMFGQKGSSGGAFRKAPLNKNDPTTIDDLPKIYRDVYDQIKYNSFAKNQKLNRILHQLAKLPDFHFDPSNTNFLGERHSNLGDAVKTLSQSVRPGAKNMSYLHDIEEGAQKPKGMKQIAGLDTLCHYIAEHSAIGQLSIDNLVYKASLNIFLCHQKLIS